MNTSATFLGPVNELPPEGDERTPSRTSAVDCCASLFSDSGLLFDVSRDGVIVTSNPQASEVFQKLELRLPEGGAEPEVTWNDETSTSTCRGSSETAPLFPPSPTPPSRKTM